MNIPSKGNILIADPFLKDPNFLRTVIILCEHQAEGSIGFVLNKRFEQNLDELLTEFEGFPIPVYYGGPVQMNTIHFLHSYPDLVPGGQEVIPGIFWGGNFEALMKAIKEETIQPDDVKFFIGYSGWGAEQLEQEMKEKSWITSTANRDLIFFTEAEQLWKVSLQQLGGEYEMMVHYPIDPQLN